MDTEPQNLVALELIRNLQSQAEAMQHEIAALTRYVDEISKHTAAIGPIAKVIDDNESATQSLRQIEASKQLINHLYREAHTYLVVVVAAGYAALFSTLHLTAPRLPNGSLYASALLLTSSLTIFVFWEVLSMAYISWLMLRGQFGVLESYPLWYRIGWPIALLTSIGTALPAAVLLCWKYYESLQGFPLL